MMRIFTIFVLLLAAMACNAQCISLADMRLLFKRDTEAQDEFLESKGYRLNSQKNDMPAHQMVWTSKYQMNDADIYVRYDLKKEVIDVELWGTSIKNCYDGAKAEMLVMGFMKDGEAISEHGELSVYYSVADYGIILTKSNTREENSKPYYFV